MTPEGKIEKHLKKQVEGTGGKVRKLQWIGKRGAPDRMVWWPGPKLAFVELKARNKKPSKIQSEEHKSMLADGFQVFVIDSIEAVNIFVDKFRGKSTPLVPSKIGDVISSLQRTPKYDVKTPADLPKPDNSDLV